MLFLHVPIVVLLFAQDMQPRRWTHLPSGTNVADVTYAYSTGDLHVDPALRIENAEVDLHTSLVSYTHYFGLGDMTARADLQLPIQSGRWKGLLDGVPSSVGRTGLGDPRIRFSLNFVGSPALDGEEFKEYLRTHENRTIAGAALAVRLPLGEYDDDKLINLGDHRFEFEPQLGIVHVGGPWSFELTGSVFLYLPNDDFFNGSRLEKEPLYALQAHVVRTFDPFWISAGASYGLGGRSEVDGDRKDDQRSNLLVGVLAGVTFGGQHGLRVGYVRQVALRKAGGDLHNFLAGWSIRF
jgi:hypothetical protein